MLLIAEERRENDGRGERNKSVFSTFRTDYWVSQERKYCEFCKCYISANKAVSTHRQTSKRRFQLQLREDSIKIFQLQSIEFHENGKNHKENLAKRLTEMQKKAAKEKKDAARFENEMKKIEAVGGRTLQSLSVTDDEFG